MARRNPEEDEEGTNPLLILGIVGVIGILGYMMISGKKSSTPTMTPQQMAALQQQQQQAGILPGQQQPTGVAAGIAAILNPLAQAGATVYSAHNQAQVQKAQIAQRGY